jgi:hypothetical protein
MGIGTVGRKHALTGAVRASSLGNHDNRVLAQKAVNLLLCILAGLVLPSVEPNSAAGCGKLDVSLSLTGGVSLQTLTTT